MSFKVIKPGFMSTIQDLGRFGYADKGLAQSGAADSHAFCWANYLLGNDINAAQLEITFGGCELEALSDMHIAITGAEFLFKVNGHARPNWQSLCISRGDRLSWSSSKQGVRAYLAVAGGFQTPVYFGSRSVNVREHIGQTIQQDEILDCIPTQSKQILRCIPDYFKPDYRQPLVLSLVPSYQYQAFRAQEREQFFNQTYLIDRGTDRSGCRLMAEPLFSVPEAMISEGMAFGSVEITSAGLPIILLNDQPTIGGYPKIGTVLSLDLAQLAQRHAGSSVRFKLIDIEQAQQRHVAFNRFFGIRL